MKVLCVNTHRHRHTETNTQPPLARRRLLVLFSSHTLSLHILTSRSGTQKQDCWSVGHFPRVLGELERLPKENCKILIPIKGRHTGAKLTLSARCLLIHIFSDFLARFWVQRLPFLRSFWQWEETHVTRPQVGTLSIPLRNTPCCGRGKPTTSRKSILVLTYYFAFIEVSAVQ